MNGIDEQTLDLLSRIASDGKILASSAAYLGVIRANKLMRRSELVNVQRTRKYGGNDYEYTPLGSLKELTEEVDRIRSQQSHELQEQIVQRVTNIMHNQAVETDAANHRKNLADGYKQDMRWVMYIGIGNEGNEVEVALSKTESSAEDITKLQRTIAEMKGINIDQVHVAGPYLITESGELAKE